MQVVTKQSTDTEAVLTITADTKELATIKQHVLKELSSQVKVPGFREGKTPPEMIEKHVEPTRLQTEYLEHAINDIYPGAVQQSGLRPVGPPNVEIKKFVPFSTLEFTATIPVIGGLQLADYTKFKKDRPLVKLTAKDVDDVIDALRQRAAKAEDVDRPAKSGDQVIIDFKGVDDKGEPVKGADGKDYPLTLGSNSFIPGFEDNLVGMTAGEEKTFTLQFPKDYGVKALANRNVTFTVTVKKVQAMSEPALDDTFAASIGPVKTVEELKADIKKELQVERQRQADLDYESELVKELTTKSKLKVPQGLIDEQTDRLWREVQQNLMYRGQTAAEFLESDGKTEEEYKKTVLASQAEDRVKAGILLAEVADKEKIEVTKQELDIRMQALKAQYTDAQMQAELEKPETRRDIASRMLSEKTVAKLAAYANRSLAGTLD